jgi:tetratricopeptide (TPR) repeat protein
VVVINRSCFEKAIVLFERKEFRGALKQIDECLVQNPQDTKARLLKIEILTSLEEYDTVINQLTTWSLEASESQVWLQALHLLSRATKAPKNKIIAALEKIHHQKPKMLLPILLLADMYSRENKSDNALIYLQKSLLFSQSNDLKSRILYQMGVIYYEKLNYPAMKQVLEQADNLGADYPPALNLLAYYYATEGKQVAKAEALIEKALAKDGENPHFLDTKALVLYKQGKYQQALDILKPIAQAVPNDSTIMIHLAKTYRKLGNVTQACAILDNAKKCATNLYEQQTTTALLNQWKQ